ncbi:MAG: carboxypeptidase-like regulatory domain-containing protein [bacterium]
MKPHKTVKILVISLFLLVLGTGCNLGFWGKTTGSISGKVLDADNKPLAAATVTTSPETSPTVTNSNGFFSIDNVSKGDYTVTFTKAGYQDKSTTATVDSGASFSCWGSSSDTYIEIHLFVN